MKVQCEYGQKVITEQKKEIARLHKLLAKKEVQHHSEIAKLQAKLEEAKKNPILIQIPPVAEDL